jgi:hypothetical protein
MVPLVVESRAASQGAAKLSEPVIDPQHWRDCALAARTKAQRVQDVRFKRIMLTIADVYDGLAERVEQHLCDHEDQDQASALLMKLACPLRLSIRHVLATRANLLESYRAWVLSGSAR